MSYTLTCSSSEDCLSIRIDGKWAIEKPEDIISDILKHWAKHHNLPLFIDARNLEDTPSILGDYENVQRFVVAGFPRGRRIAVLDKLDRRNANDFFETAACNRGLQFQFFYADEQEAISWLLSEDSIRHD